MVCLRNISVDTLHKGDTEDNNNNNIYASNFEEILLSATADSVKRAQSCHVQLVAQYLLFIYWYYMIQPWPTSGSCKLFSIYSMECKLCQ
jgi:hypothetical protein